jgi:uncharacterized protein YneF (UPF0154 family)
MMRPFGARTLAIMQALRDNPRKPPRVISAILQEQGVDASAEYVGKIKYKMKRRGRKRMKAVAAGATETATEAGTAIAPAVANDAVSVALLCKAKKLAAEFSSIKEAKAVIAALAQLLD